MINNIVMAKDDTIETTHNTETLILRAAEQEFCTKGFAGARTSAIAEAAGVTRAMFHYYFRTQEKLFEKIINEKMELLKEVMLRSLSENYPTLPETIRHIIERHIDFITANPYLPRLIMNELYSSTERAAFILKKIKYYAPIMIAGLQEKIDKAYSEGKCRKEDARMIIIDIVSLNIFPYMQAPMINTVLGDMTTDSETFREMRKKEVYDTIMRKLNYENH